MTLREQVFRKMGYKEHAMQVDDGIFWRMKDAPYTVIPSDDLPPIDSQWEVCAKYLVPFMRERGWEYYIRETKAVTPSIKTFWWDGSFPNPSCEFKEIKDDNIAEAACGAFMEVSLD